MSTSDHVIFTSLNSKGTVATSLSCSQLHKKAERIGNLLLDRGKINTGEHVALVRRDLKGLSSSSFFLTQNIQN